MLLLPASTFARFFMPETSHSRIYIDGETAADLDTETIEAAQIEEKAVAVHMEERNKSPAHSNDISTNLK